MDVTAYLLEALDEVVSTYVVLKTNFRKEHQLRELLGRLTITADVYAVGATTPSSPDNRESTQPKQLISRETLSNSQESVVVLPELEASHANVNNQAAYILWKLHFALTKPKIELQSQCFQVTAKAVLKPQEDGVNNTEEDEYLPSGVPTAINLLRLTQDSPSVIARPPNVLGAATLIPRRPFKKSGEIVKQATAKDFRAVSAFDARIRLCRLNDHPTKATLIATLRIKIASSAGCDVAIDSIAVLHSSGQIQPMVQHPMLGVPVSCKPVDEISFVYNVIPSGLSVGQFSGISKAKRLTVNISATALVNETCQPQIKIKLETDADPISDIKVSSRRSLQAQDEAGLLGPLTTQATVGSGLQGDVLAKFKEKLEQTGFASQDGSSDSHNFGIGVTVTGHDDVYVWENFTWEVLVVNRSAQERTLVIIPIVRRATFDYRIHLLDLADTESAGHRYAQLADAVKDDKRSQSIDRDAIRKPGELMSVSPDVQAG